MSCIVGLLSSLLDGTGRSNAIDGSFSRRSADWAATQLTLNRVARAPTATGVAVVFDRSHV